MKEKKLINFNFEAGAVEMLADYIEIKTENVTLYNGKSRYTLWSKPGIDYHVKIHQTKTQVVCELVRI
tara:strand:- start:180 stop:383 length:204 start_codon:yes stop_codon:yes gene_type:complete